MPPITFLTAPCCWGVEDANNPHVPPWERVLDEAAAAGYGGLELGPFGYVPPEPERVAAALDQRGLVIAAGTIFDDLVSSGNRDLLLRKTEEICGLTTRLPQPVPFKKQRFLTPYLVVIDWGTMSVTLLPDMPTAPLRLSDEDWATMVSNITAIAGLAKTKYGVRAVIHPHAGSYIEFADEIARITSDVPADVAGLCLDTGHTQYAGMDPVGTLRKYADRLDYVHFKDINGVMFERVLAKRIRFFEACAEGVMCPIGRGVIDYPGIKRLLEGIGDQGFVTVEQERDPRNASSTLADVKASLDYLKTAGF